MYRVLIVSFVFQAFANAEAQKQIEMQHRFQQEQLKRQQEHLIQQHKIQELQVGL